MSTFQTPLNSTEDWELEIGKPAEGDKEAGESGAPGYLQGAKQAHTLTVDTGVLVLLLVGILSMCSSLTRPRWCATAWTRVLVGC